MQHTLCAAAAASTCAARAADKPGRILFGVCTSPNNAERLKAIGYDSSNTTSATPSSPRWRTPITKSNWPSSNSQHCRSNPATALFPARSGSRAPRPRTTQHRVCGHGLSRADLLGVPYIVFGSGTARKLPDGFDPVKGKEQFIDFCRKLGDRIQNLKVTIVLEPLNTGETNLLNSVTEGIEYVDTIARPRIQLLADFYHMMKEDEGPDAIRKAGARIRHCHIAELEGRKAPGTKGEDLSGYFKALRDIGYTGGVSCECGWPKENIEDAWKKALATMRQQAGQEG